MKKILGFLSLFVLSFFAIQVKCYAVTCEYNLSGYKDDAINWTLDTSNGKATQKKAITSNMFDTNRAEDILNWSGSNYSVNVKDSLASGECPKYLIQSLGVSGILINDKMFAAQEDTLATVLSYEEVQKKDSREVRVIQLANRTKRTTTGATCHYKGNYQNDFIMTTNTPIDITLYYDGSGNLLSMDSSIYGGQSLDYITASYSVYQKQIQADTCNSSMAICQVSDNYDAETHGYPSYVFYLSGADKTFEDRYSSESNDGCTTFSLDEDNSSDSSGNRVESSENCDAYDKYWPLVEESAQNYGTCKNDKDNCSTYLEEFNRNLLILDSICESVYKQMTYGDSCVKKCVTEKDQNVASLKEENGIMTIQSGNSCNISERLAAWLIRIVSWVRYIVPVAIIILTILDFIKAIAADNEDEIKKVSGKFAKRLIVALIIFLLPLLLEFILGIFGQDTYQYCLK